MAYMRGDNYLWKDESAVHFWLADGYDCWDESVWSQDLDMSSGEPNPGGVAVPFEVIDEFVVMRLAELIEAGEMDTVVDRTLGKWKGNGGCSALTQLADRLKRLGT